MALVSSTEIANFAEIFSQHFDLFGSFRNIVINKKPSESFSTTITNNVFPGYADPSNLQNITYTPVSGVFPAIVRYNLQSKNPMVYEPKLILSQGQCQIKVKPDCRDFIINGTTENIIVDGYPNFIVSDDGAQNYLGVVYFYFILQRTK